ncbi:uncharacterized protein LOC143181390 [Calliopsis andreniformis]|uniref:uncharacterized protein LOC143181390 n=1 Tax=Calliopsis andreniformis TaxID=337506 RepID=UPI003FCDE57A
MELLVIFLLSPLILVQGYGKTNDPNDEPFLPIYPVYPYSPKLIKRGTDRDTVVTQLTPELYAPKADAKDSYSASFSSNYPRDPYYPNYNPYTKASSSPSYSYYGSLPQSYSSIPYSSYGSYSTPYTIPSPSYSAIPYSSSYPNYYYQPPYYYPGYYSQPLFPPPPLPPPSGEYPSDSYSDSEAGDKSRDRKPSEDKRYRDNDNQDSSGNQFMDGGNYISGSSRDLDSQPSTYKASSPQNQLEQMSDLHVKSISLPLPKTTYRVISVAGQPVGPDYPLPPTYAKAQQLEELMSQTWAKVLAQNLQQAAQYQVQEGTGKSTGAGHVSQTDNRDTQRYVSVPNVIAKTGLAYIVNPSILTKLNVGQATGQISQVPTTQLKNVRYPQVTPGIYAAVEKPAKNQAELNDYQNYENSSSQDSQDYDSSPGDKSQQKYENDDQSYQNQNFVTVQTPRGYNYQYNGYNPSQSNEQQPQQYKTNLDDVNFGTKTKKG